VHFNALYIGGSVGRKEISLKVLTHLFSDSDWQGGVDLSIETGEASWRVLQKLLLIIFVLQGWQQFVAVL